jgi:Uncharacterized conserved protein
MKRSSAFFAAKTLIPQNCDLTKWSVVACDQYTSQPDYWKEVEELVGDDPSTYHMIVPEIYLESPDVDKRITNVNQTMQQYIKDDLFKSVDSLIYVERTERSGAVRRGIVGSIDLEQYDYQKGSSSYIRATEKTVLERIPARVNVRQNAALELPHVMVLIDDEKKAIIEPLSDLKGSFPVLYDFPMMQNSGHITGYQITKDAEEKVLAKLANLEDPEYFANKYQAKDAPALAYAIGDGNHSLAAAKTCYENLKRTLSKEEAENHPARYALVELVNLHDESLKFEAIHRVLFNVDATDFLQAMKTYYEISDTPVEGAQHFSYVSEDKEGDIYVKNPSSNLPVGTFQNFADAYLEKHPGKIDYIHGDDVTKKIGKEQGNIGFLFPCMKKEELFATVITDGSLPRKTFSMGHAEDKRFYLECRSITF